MLSVDTKEIWRQIPPEEKIIAMAKAHSVGFTSSAVTVITCSTLAVGFKVAWLMWASIIISPIIFQFASGKAWRDIRPRMMLEYLAARSAARRHAFNIGGKNLDMVLMFRGKLEEVFEDEQKKIQAEIDRRRVKKVWVALFNDSFVMMSERIGGAELRFGHLINNKISVRSNEEEVGEYSSDKELEFVSTDKEWVGDSFKLTSDHPAALIAFEKTLKDKIKLFIEGGDVKEAVTTTADSEIEEDDFL